MSERSGDVFVVANEPPRACETCGTVAELRPYGLNGAWICFGCGMKDKPLTDRMFRERVTGVTTVVVDGPVGFES